MKVSGIIGTLLIALVTYGNEPLKTVELRQGGAVTGEVLREWPERVVIDLGFTILEIPRESIARVLNGNNDDTAEETYNEEQLYRLSSKRSSKLPIKELVERYGEAVVLIQTPTSLGSGFIIHPDGYVITNDHVIAGEYKITVTLYERTGQETVNVPFQNIRIIATSLAWDLALLKIEGAEGRTFNPVSLGDSGAVRPGQSVFAIGSPLGLERTVSEGIVSLKNRLVNGQLYLQNTAQISPGNSGGPLFNLHGEVIGVNNMKVVDIGAEGLGFAIPSNVLKSFLKNRDAFRFDPRNPNAGFRYHEPPQSPQHKISE